MERGQAAFGKAASPLMGPARTCFEGWRRTGALVVRSEARVCGAATGHEHVRAVRRQDPSVLAGG